MVSDVLWEDLNERITSFEYLIEACEDGIFIDITMQISLTVAVILLFKKISVLSFVNIVFLCRICWLTSHHGQIWAFVSLVIVVILVRFSNPFIKFVFEKKCQYLKKSWKRIMQKQNVSLCDFSYQRNFSFVFNYPPIADLLPNIDLLPNKFCVYFLF